MSKTNAAIFYPHIGEYGGIERNIKALSESISAHGLQAVLVCYYDRVGLANDQLQVVELGDHWNPFVKAKRVRRWVDRHRESLSGLPLFFGCKAGFYAAMGKTSSYALHYTDPPSLLSGANKQPGNGIARLRLRLSNHYRRHGVMGADRRITMTKWNARELKSIYDRDFDVIYQGGVPSQCSPRIKPCCQGRSMRWFSVCRLTESKHLDWILHAGRRIVDDREALGVDDFKITIAGKGPALPALQRLTSELKMDEYVRFPGFLGDQEVESEFNECDLSLVPARQGFGLPVLESLYRRVPVVLSRESRVSEILESNAWACVTEHSAKAFADATYDFTRRLREEGMPDETYLHDLPTEEYWGQQLGAACGWWPEARESPS